MKPAAASIALFLTSVLAGTLAAQPPQRPRLILDSDTANEIDDLYAIVRMLRQDKFDVIGLTSAQWFHYLGDPNSVEASQRDNIALLRLLGRTELPTLQGSSEPVGKPWGGDEPKDSPAAQFIIEQAKATAPGKRLTVVCTGASTNLASAIRLAPEIVPKLRAYILGFQYDPKTGVWNKSEFNIRRDLNAADILLNQTGLELHIMSATASKDLTFNRDDTFARQQSMGALGEYLSDKWKTKFADNETWTMWDLALVEAMINPDMATESQVTTPPENSQRMVWMYDSIDAPAMRDDYWDSITNRKR